MTPEEVPAELVEKAVKAAYAAQPNRFTPESYVPGGRPGMAAALAVVLPEIQAQALASMHENYEFLFNTRGEGLAAVPCDDIGAEIARLRGVDVTAPQRARLTAETEEPTT